MGEDTVLALSELHAEMACRSLFGVEDILNGWFFKCGFEQRRAIAHIAIELARALPMGGLFQEIGWSQVKAANRFVAQLEYALTGY
jgi:hypothetical protein